MVRTVPGLAVSLREAQGQGGLPSSPSRPEVRSGGEDLLGGDRAATWPQIRSLVGEAWPEHPFLLRY